VLVCTAVVGSVNSVRSCVRARSQKECLRTLAAQFGVIKKEVDKKKDRTLLTVQEIQGVSRE
jgi:hypothetical protein